MEIELLPSAVHDLQDGYHFYEEQGEGLGDYFITSVSEDIGTLRRKGGIHRQYWPPFHRLVCSTFPYEIHYRLDGGIVVIYAVIDSRRDPEWIRRKIAGL